MSVKTDEIGRRSVEVAVELPGTPEEVWQAIATGPGIGSWFVACDVEEREGGAIAFHLGPGMDAAGVVKVWQPPQRLVYEEPDWSGPDKAPPLATEIVVEARAGGVCVVRMVHSLFTSDERWDDQLGSMESGWPPFFAVLRQYLTHFRGQPSATVRLIGGHAGPEADAWHELAGALGLAGACVGERREAPAGAPVLAGIVERVPTDGSHHALLLRLDRPAPGVALLGSFAWGGQVQVAISLYLYGDDAPAAVAAAVPVWRAWLDERFPTAESTATAAAE